ncbi:Kelch repeat and BTB domain-containing protein 2 [Orchesella cincta]|uniref:Kelch repeat and BTB domain-containing protein 2 n=1 Tax=Orchesella cincta TaxID=48709 RepID=A0A1D2M2R9_ORCCI|nr:Kelch repeat and BTB domain-containing protein 2 [Orchesella cincta]
MTAYGPILEKFLQKHTNMQLGMHLRATFDNDFTISCEMKSTLNSRAENMEDGKRVVEGSVDFDANAMFKYEQLYSGKYSLEIVNRDSFEFEAHPRDNRPMLKRFWEKMKYSDFAIIANSGVRFPCHKMVLEDLSTVLDEMLQMECPDTPETV